MHANLAAGPLARDQRTACPRPTYGTASSAADVPMAQPPQLPHNTACLQSERSTHELPSCPPLTVLRRRGDGLNGAGGGRRRHMRRKRVGLGVLLCRCVAAQVQQQQAAAASVGVRRPGQGTVGRQAAPCACGGTAAPTAGLPLAANGSQKAGRSLGAPANALTGGQPAVQHPAEQALVRLQRSGPGAHIC